MANVSNPHGFSPVGNLLGIVQKPNMYHIPVGDTNAYAVGDPVLSVATADANGVPDVVLAGNTDIPRGVVVGIVVAPPSATSMATPPDLNVVKIPATKAHDYYVLVDDDPNTIFEVQANNTGTLSTAVFGKNCNMATATAGTYVSAAKLGTGATGASAATTSTLIWKILKLAPRPNVDLTANAPLYVIANVHELKSVGTTGV